MQHWTEMGYRDYCKLLQMFRSSRSQCSTKRRFIKLTRKYVGSSVYFEFDNRAAKEF